MSMEVDSPQFTGPKKHKKPKDKLVETSEKKRKRNPSDEVELNRPKKKPRSKRPPSPIAHDAPPVQLEKPIDSPFYHQTFSLYLPLSPISQRHALQGLCAEYLSPLILSYYPPFHGVIISYSNPRLSTDLKGKAINPAYSRAVDEYAATFIWLTADFIVFKPQKGTLIEGYVNLQNESNLGLLCWNFFSASIDRKRLPQGWEWVAGGMRPSGKRKLTKAAETAEPCSEEEEANVNTEKNNADDIQGYFKNSQGDKVEGLIRFTVRDVETSRSMDRENGFLTIQGTLLSEEEERELKEQEAMRASDRRRRILNWNPEPKDAMTGALMNGYAGATDVDSTPISRHRAQY